MSACEATGAPAAGTPAAREAHLLMLTVKLENQHLRCDIGPRDRRHRQLARDLDGPVVEFVLHGLGAPAVVLLALLFTGLRGSRGSRPA